MNKRVYIVWCKEQNSSKYAASLNTSRKAALEDLRNFRSSFPEDRYTWGRYDLDEELPS